MITKGAHASARAESTDASAFLSIVDDLVAQRMLKLPTSDIILIKMDNWFGLRWLSFSGKVLGALGVHKDELTVPPFIPSRIRSQRRISAMSGQDEAPGKPLHEYVTSAVATSRRFTDVADGATAIWYSGKSLANGRGSLMAYVPDEEGGYRGWYASWKAEASWRITESAGMMPDDLPLSVPHQEA
jgi:hypothetical protein